ncbi:hypothetical protein [Limnochorda pilosa]|uniref:Uncharacterized protein n=1 Tax=Limnochorda pilosa TaxID=1555112 RepID=A0A0K2SIC5_LIMPI|nr:hypothetical protein [Limnochorda pilosa]BAS26858.1 hypothetical protein LIP_1001 [Limnochorda pilosa]
MPDDGPIAAMKRFHRTYLDGYMQRVPEGWAEYQRWLPIVAAARLSDGIVEQQEWLLEQVRSGLAASEPPPA